MKANDTQRTGNTSTISEAAFKEVCDDLLHYKTLLLGNKKKLFQQVLKEYGKDESRESIMRMNELLETDPGYQVVKDLYLKRYALFEQTKQAYTGPISDDLQQKIYDVWVKQPV